jgi:hypothetical protein
MSPLWNSPGIRDEDHACAYSQTGLNLAPCGATGLRATKAIEL